MTAVPAPNTEPARAVYGTSTTTADPPECLSLVISRDGRYYRVTDHVGTRYGHSTNALMALIGWWWQVQDLLDLDEPTGDPIKSEIAAYKAALAAREETT